MRYSCGRQSETGGRSLKLKVYLTSYFSRGVKFRKIDGIETCLWKSFSLHYSL